MGVECGKLRIKWQVQKISGIILRKWVWCIIYKEIIQGSN